MIFFFGDRNTVSKNLGSIQIKVFGMRQFWFASDFIFLGLIHTQIKDNSIETSRERERERERELACNMRGYGLQMDGRDELQRLPSQSS